MSITSEPLQRTDIDMKHLGPHILEVLNCDFTKQKMRNQNISRGIVVCEAIILTNWLLHYCHDFSFGCIFNVHSQGIDCPYSNLTTIIDNVYISKPDSN